MNKFILSSPVIMSEAANSYGKLDSGPLETGRGRWKSRLDLSEQNPLLPFTKTATRIYVEQIEKGWIGKLKELILSLMDRKFARVTINRKTLFINVNSLSNRLGIKKEDIYEAALKGTLENLIDKAYQENKKIEERVQSTYQQIIRNYQDKNGTLIPNQSEDSEKGFSSESLYQVIGLAYTLQLTQQVFLTVNKENFLFIPRKQGVEVFHFSGKKISKGSFADTERVTQVTDGTLHAAKIAHLSRKDSLRVKTEANILNLLNTKGAQLGIPASPMQCFDLTRKSLPFIGYIDSIYEGVLTDKLQSSDLLLRDRLNFTHQLLTGLAHSAKNNVAIKNIETNKCLIKTDDTGKAACFFGHFEHAKKLDDKDRGTGVDLQLFLEWTPGPSSEAYKRDEVEFKKLVKEFKRSDLTPDAKEKIKQDLIQLQKARDVYDLSCVLRDILAKDSPAPALNQLIEEMANPDYRKRITAERALQKFNTINRSIVV